jgi:hypothetical protein
MPAIPATRYGDAANGSDTGRAAGDDAPTLTPRSRIDWGGLNSASALRIARVGCTPDIDLGDPRTVRTAGGECSVVEVAPTPLSAPC